ncbi:MAG: hypothetical protein GY861_22025 [bacterium]|nr:hypothetical protein [bacterium]
MDLQLHTELSKLFTKVVDLICFDGFNKVVSQTGQDKVVSQTGPILSLFVDSEANKYLFHWCDVVDGLNRWLVFPVDQIPLERYLRVELSLRELVMAVAELYVVNIDDDLRICKSSKFTIDEIQDYYLPDIDSFYDSSLLDYPQHVLLRSILNSFSNTVIAGVLKDMMLHDTELLSLIEIAKTKRLSIHTRRRL